MRLSISNIAWSTIDDLAVSNILVDAGIDAIDVAPTKYINNPMSYSTKHAKDIRLWWENKGIEIVGMQSLLFGTKDLNIFMNYDGQQKVLEYLELICKIAELWGVKKLVFGSPKNRNRGELTKNDAKAIAITFFRQLGERAKKYNCSICLEPNPACYGSTFMLDSYETHEIVKATDHQNIQMALDLGACIINNEDTLEIVKKLGHTIGHIHASEPNLAPFGTSNHNWSHLFNYLKIHFPKRIVVLEMLEADVPGSHSNLIRSIEFLKSQAGTNDYNF